MVFVLGAASSALEALKSLTSPKSSSSQAAGSSPDPTNPFDLSGTASTPASSAPTFGASGFSQLAPPTLSALLAAQSQSSAGTTTPASTGPSAALKDLFSLLDANGDKQISKSEFENALGAGGTNLANADHVFSELDKNGDGSVNLGELSSALKGAGGKGHRHHFAGAGGSGGSAASDGSSTDPLLQALQGASSTSVTNSDGSTTTSLTYADGSKVALTSPSAKTASSTATSSYNIIEQLIQREAQALSSSVTNSLSVSV
jgi:EF-hand domain pair